MSEFFYLNKVPLPFIYQMHSKCLVASFPMNLSKIEASNSCSVSSVLFLQLGVLVNNSLIDFVDCLLSSTGAVTVEQFKRINITECIFCCNRQVIVYLLLLIRVFVF